MLKGYKYLKGYVKVRAKGNYIERFINMNTKDKIYVWDIKKQNIDTATFFVSINGFMKIRKNAKETRTKIKILERIGLPIFLSKSKERKSFYIAGVAIILLIFISSSFIWKIDVEKQDYIDESRIIQKLRENHLYVGAVRRTIDYNAVAASLVTEFNELIWANVELSGTRLKVTIVPRKAPPIVIPKNIPTNIVAKKDGSITKVVAENGDAKVKAGDTVVKGQILISGVIPSPVVGIRYLHSIGAVTAKTWTVKEVTKKLYKYNKIITGNVVVRQELFLPFIKIPLYFKQTLDFFNYDSIIEERTLFFISYKKHTYEEYNLQKAPQTLEQAVEEASLQLNEEIVSEGITNIISKKINYKTVDAETVVVTVLVESEEELGESVQVKE
jgi:similar to stage IV sporulation protein